MAQVEGQQHPISIYFWVWGLLFVLSAGSYMVDYLQVQGYLRWTLIIIFMLLKAGFITAIFMHMIWERLAMTLAILVPTGVLLAFIALMSLEGDYTNITRETFFAPAPHVAVEHTVSH
ncbi:MAG: cytochrome C oxidase subunit IV [Proteobacteria bacterium]|jgi:cytochrome c oxidase subunit IV|nr:cytochrome C oxidase subunit IV [Pseudomonadota bacterium]